MAKQRTIESETSLTDQGLFSPDTCTVTLKPAPANHGVVFFRTDLDDASVPALIEHVVKRTRRTALRAGDAVIETSEHLLSAVAASGIDNLRIELDASEVPNIDGSAAPFLEALNGAGTVELDAERRPLVIEEPVFLKQDGSTLAAVPSDEPGLQIIYELDYRGVPSIGRQLLQFHLGVDDYAAGIAPSRTFSLKHEAEAAVAAGMFTHLTHQKALVIGDDGPVNNDFRFDDEPVRHKVLDLIGDLSLVGAPIQGRIVAFRSGHPLNQRLAQSLAKQLRQQHQSRLTRTAERFDIRDLARMMPHRYPMLLVDRVLEIDGTRRAVGVKNVTINEPFFQGHYPNTPIMPGVLVVEAMAQLSGVLIGQSFKQVGKLPVLLSLDRVKLRRPVVPGDQLILEAEAVRIRSRIAHMRCRAYVAEELAAEGEVKFMLMDEDAE